jgi:LPS export ABC transporter protein LptC
MERFSDRKLIKFWEGVDIDFYEDGLHSSHIVASWGELKERTNNIDLMGNVIVHAVNGISLYTQELKWDEARGKVTSDSFVTVITVEGDTIHGTGFESGKSFQNWLIKKPYGVTQKTLNLGVRETK